MTQKLGLIAGNGRFPLILAGNARREGYEVVAAAIREETDPAIEQAADRVVWLSLTQLGALIKFFQKEGVTRAVMAGQVIKRRMYASDIFKLDMTAAKLWASLPDRRGDTILKAVADEIPECPVKTTLAPSATISSTTPSRVASGLSAELSDSKTIMRAPGTFCSTYCPAV